MLDTIETILDYWFGTLDNGFPIEAKDALWWQGSPEIDLEIKTRFGDIVTLALNGELDHWQETSRGHLALIILLDQFTRNIYRGSAQAFSGDPLAYMLTQQGLSKGVDQLLSFSERIFFYMPLEHAENLHAQQQCIQLLEALKDEVPAQQQAMIESNLTFARAHEAVIKRFGRFPHRNQVLARTSTALELEYLHQSPHRWGQ